MTWSAVPGLLLDGSSEPLLAETQQFHHPFSACPQLSISVPGTDIAHMHENLGVVNWPFSLVKLRCDPDFIHLSKPRWHNRVLSELVKCS